MNGCKACCGNCELFIDEDSHGYGTCEEADEPRSCDDVCIKWEVKVDF